MKKKAYILASLFLDFSDSGLPFTFQKQCQHR